MTLPDVVRSQIIAAVGAAPMPSVEDFLARPSSGSEVCDALVGRHWRTLNSDDITPWCYHFSYLSAAAFRHYLPALLLAGLDNYGEPFGTMYSALRAISPSEFAVDYEGRDDSFESQTSLLSAEEQEAVTTFMALFLV